MSKLFNKIQVRSKCLKSNMPFIYFDLCNKDRDDVMKYSKKNNNYETKIQLGVYQYIIYDNIACI